MSEDLLTIVTQSPVWAQVRAELCGADGLTPNETYSELCWWINNGAAYCRSAPAHVKAYLHRLGVLIP